MKKRILELPENKEEFIELLKKELGNEITIEKNNQHYLIYNGCLIETMVFIDKFDLIIKIYRNDKVTIVRDKMDINANFQIIEEDIDFINAYIIILIEIGKL